MTTENPALEHAKTKIFKVRKQKEVDVAVKMTKHISKKFPKREIEVRLATDDGGKLIEVHVSDAKLSSQLRAFLPLNWEGWRTVVINRYATGDE